MRELKPLKCPDGLAEITATFGDIKSYIKYSKDNKPKLDPAFEDKYIISIKLPFPLYLAWDHQKRVSSIKCHRLLSERFLAIFEEIARRDLSDKARYFGGCFNFRTKRSGRGFSTHSWGIAIDLNPASNKQGKSGDMAPEIVDIFAGYGFIWGGAWKGKRCDPMHFQYCSGY